MRYDLMEKVLYEKIIVIIRGVERKYLRELCEALYAGGIRFVEYTYNFFSDSETAKSIEYMNDFFSDKMFIGAGTVLNAEQVRLTKKAGGKFIISPDFNRNVVEETKKHGLLSMPAAMTSTEINEAYKTGADIVKLFPAAVLGADYLRAVTAPLKNVPIMAVGGINTDNIPGFLAAGAKAFGIGSDIVRKDMIESADYDGISRIAQKFISVVNEEE